MIRSQPLICSSTMTPDDRGGNVIVLHQRPARSSPRRNGMACATMHGLSLRSRDRRGSLTLEAVLILPVLVLVFLAVLQFGILMLVEQTVVHAATVAAREAAKGADVDATVVAAQSVLRLHGLCVGPAMTLVLEDPLSLTPVQTRGGLPCDISCLPTLTPGQVRVTLCVSLSHRPFLNALRHWAIDFTGRKFLVSAVSDREFTGQAMVTPRPNCPCH